MSRSQQTLVIGFLGAILALPVAQAQPLPDGTIACAISGYSQSRDKKGAPVRAEPDGASKILGRLAPAQKATDADNEDVPPADGLWRTEFRVIGFREGWFLIEKALHPYDDPDRRNVLGKRSTGGVKTYTGRGWISLKDVGGKFTFHQQGFPNGALFSEPTMQSKRLPAMNALGDAIQGGNSPKSVLGCQGEWVNAESHDGVKGWWKGLCGEPISDCGAQTGG